jgi:hypothetical protein
MVGVARLERLNKCNRLRLRREVLHVEPVPVDVLSDDDPSHAPSVAAGCPFVPPGDKAAWQRRAAARRWLTCPSRAGTMRTWRDCGALVGPWQFRSALLSSSRRALHQESPLQTSPRRLSALRRSRVDRVLRPTSHPGCLRGCRKERPSDGFRLTTWFRMLRQERFSRSAVWTLRSGVPCNTAPTRCPALRGESTGRQRFSLGPATNVCSSVFWQE